MPLHPKAREFAKSGLFAGLSSFEELEKRIAAIAENKGKGDAHLSGTCLLFVGSVIFRGGIAERQCK
jgi:hypothetical protein